MDLVRHVLTAIAAVVLAVELFLHALRHYEIAASGEGGRRRGLLNVLGSFVAQYLAALATLLARPLGFLWPFRLRAAAGEVPVVCLHGYAGSRANLWWLAWRLRRAGFRNVAGVNYPPLWGRPLDKARRVADAVERVLARTGASRVDLVAHSLGGLVARLYVRELGGATRVRRLVTIGTPHQGTRVAALAPDPLARSIQPGTRLVRDLGRDDPVPVLVMVTSIFSTFDAKVLPPGNAFYAGARNVEVEGIGHDAMLFSPKIALLVIEALGSGLES